ncbi:MAG: CPBP family intramembrane metalloprotease, partial [Caldilineae bacterium]
NAMRLGLILACIGLGVLSGQGPAQLGWRITHFNRELAVGLAVGLALALFFHRATLGVMRFTGERYYSPLVVESVMPRDGREFVWVLLAFLPAVLLEELLFRSLLLGGFMFLAPPGLLLVSWSVLFGLLHSPQGLWGMVGAGLAGLIFGLLFLWQGGLLAPFVAHYLANVVQVGLAMRTNFQSAHRLP